jgi:hypothetical protein
MLPPATVPFGLDLAEAAFPVSTLACSAALVHESFVYSFPSPTGAAPPRARTPGPTSDLPS